MNAYPLVISKVVQSDLCVGCGICVAQCPNHALSMDWNKYGFYVPILTGVCDNDRTCISVCPFNPEPEGDVKTEDEISSFFLTETSAHADKIGKYIGLYAGHSTEFRETSSSGGLATFVSRELLRRGIVDYIVAVRESKGEDSHYEYGILKGVNEVSQGSQTKYYPVTLADVIRNIKDLDGNVAVSGIPCFVKGLRLAQKKDLVLNAKVKFVIGIICGGLKSRLYTDYLGDNVGVAKSSILNPKYRIKDFKSNASDYSFGCTDKLTSHEKKIKMRTLGDMWGTGLFKANACDFCDDVLAELADISLGDAWVEPYVNDGAGTNIIITRSIIADQIVNEGIASKTLEISRVSEATVVHTQRGSFNHRQAGLGYRILLANKKGLQIPPKRKVDGKISFVFKLVQRYRLKIRRASLELYVAKNSFSQYERQINAMRKKLRFFTKVYHFYNKRIAKFL